MTHPEEGTQPAVTPSAASLDQVVDLLTQIRDRLPAQQQPEPSPLVDVDGR